MVLPLAIKKKKITSFEGTWMEPMIALSKTARLSGHISHASYVGLRLYTYKVCIHKITHTHIRQK